MTKQEKEILKRISQLLELEERKISMSSNIRNTEGWDSLNHVNLIIMLEKEFDIHLSPATFDESTSAEGIINLIRNSKDIS